MSESNGLYNQLCVKDNLMLFGLNKERIDYYIDLFGLSELKKQKVCKLSKGMKRRVAMARTLVGNPDIILLDEPFDGIDIESKSRIINAIKEWVKDGNHCVIRSSHNLQEIEEMCDIVGILDGETIFLDSNLENDESIFSDLVDRFNIMEFNKVYYNLEEIYKRVGTDE